MGAAGAGLGLEPGLATDASTILDAARLRAAAPALAATRALYADAFAAGYSVAFVTGRRDRGGMRNATVANLAAAGYGGPCDPRGGMGDTVATAPLPLPKPATSPPLCYSALLMRGGGDVRPASEVKPELRAALTAGGLEVVASLGDQFSDLTGKGGRGAGKAGRAGRVPGFSPLTLSFPPSPLFPPFPRPRLRACIVQNAEPRLLHSVNDVAAGTGWEAGCEGAGAPW